MIERVMGAGVLVMFFFGLLGSVLFLRLLWHAGSAFKRLGRCPHVRNPSPPGLR